jgi:tetratricopeptide (TPR) repeat protein
VTASEAPMSRLFVGRQRELAQIGAAIDEATASGRLVLLIGEPGIGKTSLADQAAAAAVARGMPVLWGRCWESGGAPAYWPWLDVLSELARRLGDGELGEALSDGASLVSDLLPSVRMRLPDLANIATAPAEEARFRLWRAVAALVKRAAQPAGLVIVLDDLHAADRSSLQLLHFLARELRSMRVLLLGTYRDVEARMDAETSDLLTRIGREGLTLALARLSRDAAASLVRQRAGPVEQKIEAQILDSAQGNPLFVEEMVRLLGEQGQDAITAGIVPHGVRDLIRQRLDRVAGQARPLLDLAAVAGDQIDIAVLAASVEAAASAVSARLEETARAGVLASRAGRWLFSHALVREVLYRELPAADRQALHGRLVNAIEQVHGQGAAPPLAELAHHALAGPPEMLARAIDYAMRAALRAQQLTGYQEAVSGLGRALAAVEAAGDPADLRARVLLALGEARIRAGEAAIGQGHCREASTLARALGDAELAAAAALSYGRVFMFGTVDPVLVGMLEESLDALPPGDSPLRALLLARLGAALQPTRQMEEPIAVAREAIAIARRLGDPATLLEALHDGVAALMDMVDPREQLALNLEAEALARRLGDRERLLRTYRRLALIRIALGELDAAEAHIDAFDQLATELRAPWYRHSAPMLRAIRAVVEGRFAEAERLVEEAARLAEAANDPQAPRLMVIHHEAFLRAAERHDELRAWDPRVERSWAPFPDASLWQAAASALIFTRLEDEARARFHLERLPDEFRPPVGNLFSIFFVAEPAAYVGPPELCERLYARISELPDEYVMLGMIYMWEGPRVRLLAILAARLRRWDQAFAHFEDALARLRRLGARPYLARTEYEYGRALLSRGAPGDAARAAPLLHSARAAAIELGMSGLARLVDQRVGAAAGDNDGDGDGGGPATAGVPLSFTLEGEYWAITYDGAVFRLKDSLGLQYLVRLFGEPGRELHVLDLVGEKSSGDSGPNQAVDTGDAGELLDDDARASYRSRLDDLRETLAEAESFGDGERAARAREEIEFLGAELARAVGLGGRSRRAGGAAERARSAVQRRIKNALQRIGEHAPGLAAYLGRTVKTGNYCTFRP